MITGKDYIELLEKKNFRLDDVIFDPYSENNKIQDLYIYKTYLSNYNDQVCVEITFYCKDICSFNEYVTSNENDLKDEEIDNKINYKWFDCVSVNIYGEIMISDSLDMSGSERKGIGLKNKEYFINYEQVSPYELSLENLEQGLYIQESKDKTAHINFLLQNYIYHYSRVIEPVIMPIMESWEAFSRSSIMLVVQKGVYICDDDNEIRLDFIKNYKEESVNGNSINKEAKIFSVYIDFLYGDLYGVIHIDAECTKYILLNEITKEELLEELKTDANINYYCNYGNV